ncbi:diiron oxygenase [Actinomadura atramentaria]|uniref:diiron oxygenase n=1 Tax=Actinomadura atramentaria TaxID=1990 RepID=UPI00036A8F2A|nr:diiron oxygenase [Actinomadura atramentaria]
MKSPLADWYDSAGVRTDPRRVLAGDLRAGRALFSEKLIPYLDHPHVARLGPERRREVVARHLYQYLAFTAHFETRVVNRAAERIANNRLGLATTTESRMDAFKIYCDEGYHALYSFDVIAQVERGTGIEARVGDFDPFLRQLDAIGSDALPGDAALAELLQVIVFETLVTSILRGIPNDRNVITVVRDIVRDHAEDEGRHHAYFSRFFTDLWASLGPGLRARTARCLPGLVHHSLAPDTAPVRASLLLAGLDEKAADEVVHDVYSPSAVREQVNRASRHTVQLFERTGVLDGAEAREGFAALGLV